MKTNNYKKTLNRENFYVSSIAIFFKVARPNREVDFTSSTGDGNFPSQYWFGEDSKGGYVIRHADHWGRVQNCLWFITDKEMSVYAAIHDRITFPTQEDLYGKCYFSEMLDLSGIKITFENHTFESYKEKLIKRYDFVATPSYSNSRKTRYEDEISLLRKGHASIHNPYNPIVFRLDYKLVPQTHIELVNKCIDREYSRYLNNLDDYELWKAIKTRYKQEFVYRNLHYISECVPFRYAQNYDEDIFINPSKEIIEESGGSILFTSVDEVINYGNGSLPFPIIAAIKAMKYGEESINEMGLSTSPFTNLSETPLGFEGL